MIKSYSLKNFKSHKETNLLLRPLTVLCGSNSVGKSSIIQSLLLIRETYLSNHHLDFLDLKSNPVNIGVASDALYQFAQEDEIAFKINSDYNELMYYFSVSGSGSLSKTLIYKSENVEHIDNSDRLHIESLFNKNFQYVSAARMGPQAYYPKDDVVVSVRNQISVNEGKAEHFVHFLQHYQKKKVLELLRNSTSKFEDLLSQTIAWEQEISTGVEVVIEDLGTLGYDLSYQFSTESNNGKTAQFKASNVGFGLTYAMPVIIALLSADIDSLLLIENPEAHLHPNGQNKLAELICLAAQAGIQIILETHSDHIINSILVQCKKFETENQEIRASDRIGISRDNVSIYSFSINEIGHYTESTKVPIELEGKIRYPPTTFFDQFTIDRKYLMGF